MCGRNCGNTTGRISTPRTETPTGGDGRDGEFEKGACGRGSERLPLLSSHLVGISSQRGTRRAMILPLAAARETPPEYADEDRVENEGNTQPKKMRKGGREKR